MQDALQIQAVLQGRKPELIAALGRMSIDPNHYALFDRFPQSDIEQHE